MIILLSLSSDLDLKNNYSPLSQTIKLSLFDECSKLDISYIDKRFNDNYNTQPSETINISLSMDYLGFLDTNKKVMYFLKKQVILIMVIKSFFKIIFIFIYFISIYTQMLFMKKIILLLLNLT